MNFFSEKEKKESSPFIMVLWLVACLPEFVELSELGWVLCEIFFLSVKKYGNSPYFIGLLWELNELL